MTRRHAAAAQDEWEVDCRTQRRIVRQLRADLVDCEPEEREALTAALAAALAALEEIEDDGPYDWRDDPERAS